MYLETDYSKGFQAGILKARDDFKKLIPQREVIPKEYLDEKFSHEFIMGFTNGYNTGYEQAQQVAKDLAKFNGHI